MVRIGWMKLSIRCILSFVRKDCVMAKRRVAVHKTKRLMVMDACNGNVYVINFKRAQTTEWLLNRAAKEYKLNLPDCMWMVTSNMVQFVPEGLSK